VLPWQRSELDIWSSVDTGHTVRGLEVVDVPVSWVGVVEQVARKCVLDSFSEKKSCKVSNRSNES
jgi:hypothetical protein